MGASEPEHRITPVSSGRQQRPGVAGPFAAARDTDSNWHDVPDSLLAKAEATGSGDLLWPIAAASEVIRWAEQVGATVHGGEVYLAVGPAKARYLFEWRTSPSPRPNEARAESVRRGARQAAEAIGSAATAAAAHPSHLVFFLEIKRPGVSSSVIPDQ
jgi:hypothetical protein